MCQEHFNKEAGCNAEGTEQQNSTADVGTNEKSHKTPSFRFLHDVASLHAHAVVKKKQRANLFSDIGPYRRALCSQRDLFIRKQLYKQDKTSESALGFQAHPVDPDLYKLSLQLFKKARGGLAEANKDSVQPLVEAEPVGS